jgi:hypothetical protein
LIYLVNNSTFSVSYQELKAKYLSLKNLSDEEFFRDIPDVLHFVCIVCFLKETPSYLLLSDTGLIHQLTHLMCLDEPLVTGKKNQIRQDFNDICELV